MSPSLDWLAEDCASHGEWAGKRGAQAMTKARHALTNAEYHAESANSVRVAVGDKWGRFDRFGAWLEGEIRHCDPQLCIWLTGIFVVQGRARTSTKSQEKQHE